MEVKCKKCAAPLRDRWLRCGKCGSKVVVEEEDKEQKMQPLGSTMMGKASTRNRRCSMFLNVDPRGTDRAVGPRSSSVRRAVVAKMKGYFTTSKYDLIVLGGGPAGVKAALEGAGRGLRVGLIEPKGAVTGAPTGTHSKCLREAVVAGIEGRENWPQVARAVDDTILRATALTSRQLAAFHVNVRQGTAEVMDRNSLEFTPAQDPGEEVGEKQTLTFDTLVIATGSRGWRRPPTDFSLPGVFDTDTIWDINQIPKRLVVQGAGIIGLEYAVILTKLGCESCILVDPMPTILPMLDVSLVQACKATAKQYGLEMVMHTMFEKVEAMEGSTEEEPQLRITLAGGRVLECDMLLSATGRYGCSAGLGLEKLEESGLKIGRGFFIQTDEWGYTGCGQIYAVGDVAAGNLATIAQSQAVRAVRHAYGTDNVRTEVGAKCKPSAVWTIPEMAWAGANEAELTKSGVKYSSVSVDFSQTLRACVAKVEEGFLKLIFEVGTGKVLGVHMFGETSADFINFGAEIVNEEKTIYDMLQFVFPAVTYHELYTIAATEAKLKLNNDNSTHLAAAVTWNQVERLAKKTAEATNITVVEVLREAFEFTDQDRTGLITEAELHDSLESMGMELEEQIVREMFEEATGNPESETLDYKHFLRMFDGVKDQKKVVEPVLSEDVLHHVSGGLV